MSKKNDNFDLRRLIISLSPILIFIFLVPFMSSQVPYHADLSGNVDGTGSKWFLFIIVAVLSLEIYYIYGKKDEKKIVNSIVLLIMSTLNILLLTGSIYEADNLITGFLAYLNGSYGNQVTFLLFCISLIMFLLVERIPPNSIIGIKNSVTNSSETAWKMVHSKSRMQFWYCASVNIYIFLIPTISPIAKLITSFLVMAICWIYVTLISRSVSKNFG